MNGNEEALEIAKECDKVNNIIFLSMISTEEYQRRVYYFYWENKEVLKRRLTNAKRDVSALKSYQ